jgi:hypothetical protein
MTEFDGKSGSCGYESVECHFLILLVQLPNRPYSRSEVIHRAGDESLFPAFERERPRIVNNFAASASSGYELSSISEKMNWTRLSNLAVVLGSGNEYSDEDESSLETITSGYKEFASDLGRAKRP